MDPLPDEKQWIKRFQAGDAAAFAKIMGHYEPYVLGLVWRMTGDRHAAEDICQEVFIKVLKGLGRFRTDSSLKTWIFRIAHNAALDHKRSEKPMESLADRDETLAGGGEGRDRQPLAHMEDAQLRKAIETGPGGPAGPAEGSTPPLLLGRAVRGRNRNGSGHPGRYRQDPPVQGAEGPPRAGTECQARRCPVSCDDYLELLDEAEPGTPPPAAFVHHAVACPACGEALRLALMLESAPAWAERMRLPVDMRAHVLAKARMGLLFWRDTTSVLIESAVTAVVVAGLAVGRFLRPAVRSEEPYARPGSGDHPLLRGPRSECGGRFLCDPSPLCSTARWASPSCLGRASQFSSPPSRARACSCLPGRPDAVPPAFFGSPSKASGRPRLNPWALHPPGPRASLRLDVRPDW